jgi:hypothetical protein
MQEVTVSTVGTAAEVIGKVAETTTVIVGGMGVMSKTGGGKGLVATGRGIEDMEGSDGILLVGMYKAVLFKMREVPDNQIDDERDVAALLRSR